MHLLRFESLGIVIGQAMTTIVGVSALLIQPSLVFLIMALLCGSLFNAVFSAFLVAKRLGREATRPIWNFRLAKPLLIQSAPFALAAIFVKLYSYVDSILISKFIGTQAVGIYSIAYKYTYAFQFIPLAFVAALYPGLSHLLVADRARIRVVMEDALLYLMVLGTPIACGIFALAPDIVHIAGDAYAQSVPVLRTLIFVLIPIFLDFPIGSLLNASGRQKTKTAIFGATMIVNVVLNIFLIPRLGIVGAAYAALGSFLFLFFTGLYFLHQIVPELSVAKLGGKLIVILFSGLAMAWIVMALRPQAGFVGSVGLGGIVYVVLLFVTRIIKKDHLRHLRVFKRQTV